MLFLFFLFFIFLYVLLIVVCIIVYVMQDLHNICDNVMRVYFCSPAHYCNITKYYTPSSFSLVLNLFLSLYTRKRNGSSTKPKRQHKCLLHFQCTNCFYFPNHALKTNLALIIEEVGKIPKTYTELSADHQFFLL